jgi:hypothetical protein
MSDSRPSIAFSLMTMKRIHQSEATTKVNATSKKDVTVEELEQTPPEEPKQPEDEDEGGRQGGRRIGGESKTRFHRGHNNPHQM